jgi:hypothetical protein
MITDVYVSSVIGLFLSNPNKVIANQLILKGIVLVNTQEADTGYLS